MTTGDGVPNALELSDEAFRDTPMSSYTPSEGGVDSAVEPETDATTIEETEGGVAGSEDNVDIENTSEEALKDSDGDAEDTDITETTDTTSITINFEDEYKKLLAPFRANNKDIQVDSVEDARTLMQMGANYNKKMAALKPNLKLIKMLDNNGLLDESKLSYLIDLDKKNPDAVKKFIKESGVDTDTLDLDEKIDYKPSTYTVNDKEVELDGILDKIKDTTSFNTTVDIISNKWDSSSKQVLYENPGIIETINEHVATGIYSKIEQAVEKQRVLGKLDGLSDLEAYKLVGDQIHSAGGFNDTTPVDPIKRSINKIAPEVKKTVDPKLRDRKKAASSTQGTATSKRDSEYNPLSLSDEEFSKAANSKFM